MKVLIVDLDRDLLEMLKSWLKTIGYEMHRVYSGEQAELVWEEQEPDLVLLDPIIKDVNAMSMCRDGDKDELCLTAHCLAVHLLGKVMWKRRDCLSATFRFYEQMSQVANTALNSRVYNLFAHLLGSCVRMSWLFKPMESAE